MVEAMHLNDLIERHRVLDAKRTMIATPSQDAEQTLATPRAEPCRRAM